jgi:hypothetical protein
MGDTGPAGLPSDQQAIQPNELYEWVRTQTPKSAEAVFIGGNGFGAIGVIEALEENLNRPILTANQVAFRNTDAGTEMVTMRWGMPRHRARAAAGHASGPDERQSRTLRARRGAARQSRRRGRLAHDPEKCEFQEIMRKTID